MDEEEQNRYVVQLKEEFDSCDTTGTGYLDKEELTALCGKLHLEAHLPLLLGTLLGPHHYSRVNFEEFKEGFVAVLSRSLDLSTSEEETSYLEPVVPEEVKPKFVKGTKRYGRRSRPDGPDSELTADSEETPPLRPDQPEPFPSGVRRAKLRRSTSLESVESLKSDEETGSTKDVSHQTFEAQGQLKRWKRDAVETPRPSPVPRPSAPEAGDGQTQGVWEELGAGGDGFLTRPELSVACRSLGLQDLGAEELDVLFRRLDKDKDGRVSLREFQKGLFKHGLVPAPASSSTPIRLLPQRSLTQAFEDSSVRSTSPSILSPTVGQRLLSRLDDGSGCASADRIITTWSDEGIRNSRDILQTLDFSLDEKVSLAELTLALDNELLVSGNGIHQAALISYKNEIQFLQVLSEQACRERDKVKVDLDRAERRNLHLVREVDDRHATMETLNETKIRGLEQEFRDRLTALRSESEQESEVLLQQVEQERSRLQVEVESLRAQDASLREEIGASNQENGRLEKELSGLKGKLSEAEGTIAKLQRDLDGLLLDKFGSLDPNHAGMNQEERFSEIIKEYELQCRELRDRNDELNSELEMLKSQGGGRKSRRARDGLSTQTWSSRRALTTESDSDDPEMKRGTSPLDRKKLQVADKNGLGSLENMSANVSIETELAVEQLKEQHSREVQDLKIQLETKVNFYERSLELMRRNMEVERKDISQAFKMEISELEEQKAQAEERAERLRESLEEARAEARAGAGSGAGTWGPEQERRAQRERAELEQNYAREIGNLVQRLTGERDQLEAELKLRMDEEVQLVRAKLEEVATENTKLKDRLVMSQEDVQRLEEEVHKSRKKLEERDKEHEKSREEVERLFKENARYREEVLELSARNLQLSGENAELSARLRADQGAAQLLTARLAQLSREQEEGAAAARQLQEAADRTEREQLQRRSGWGREKELLEAELNAAKEKLQRLADVEAELTGLALKHEWLEKDKERLQREVEDRAQKMQTLQDSLQSLSSQAEQLHSQLQTVTLEKGLQAQELAANQRMLQEAKDKVKGLEASVERLRREKEELTLSQQHQEGERVQALQEQCQTLRSQNQDLLHQVDLLQLQQAELQKVTQECQTLKTRQAQLETAVQEGQDQLLKANAALTLAQSQHAREVQELRERAGAGSREQLAHSHARLAEEQRRALQLEERLAAQSRQTSTQLTLQQEQYEKSMNCMEEKMEEVEAKLKNLRSLLQEKVNQLKEQLAKNAKADVLLKDLYVENSQLMKALQVTEQRQKNAEKKNFLLEEKIVALNKLLRRIAPTSLTT
ncbi:ninein-like protein [Anguilla anguilla]|uniref:ninein-like protein n=1 Tax=Anguilla anguilla TaxID=7936 RepID=UPI0015AEAC97|nr:ninein-like protein [Anguilla anguilla]